MSPSVPVQVMQDEMIDASPVSILGCRKPKAQQKLLAEIYGPIWRRSTKLFQKRIARHHQNCQGSRNWARTVAEAVSRDGGSAGGCFHC